MAPPKKSSMAFSKQYVFDYDDNPLNIAHIIIIVVVVVVVVVVVRIIINVLLIYKVRFKK